MAEDRQDNAGRLLRLLHLVSPSLPTGAFAYSQGLEWAVDQGWIQNAAQLRQWLTDLIDHSLAAVDIPLLARMHAACEAGNASDLETWCDQLLALRETHELRLEENNRGRAMLALLQGLAIPLSPSMQPIIARCQLAGFAAAAAYWRIPLRDAAAGYVWAWLENQVIAGIKIIPLGQTQGHRILAELDAAVAAATDRGLCLEDDDIGASSPALAIASCRHETQYTRLYRS
jgi:urease accessory protein